MTPMLSKNGNVVVAGRISIAWDAVNNRPVDWQGEAGRTWEDLKAQHNITEPAPYVTPPPTAADIRLKAFRSDADRQALINAVKNATPAQIKTYITNNVTDLASARAMLIKLTLLVAMTLRE